MDRIVVLDFGGQYCHLISRRIRDLGVFSEVLPPGTGAEKLKGIQGLKGLILSGGAASVYDKGSPKCEKDVLDIGVPVLGICYGHQLIAQMTGGDIAPGDAGEYGKTEMKITKGGKLLEGLPKTAKVWMNHRDVVKGLGEGHVVARTENSPVAAFEGDKIYGVQFHPEVTHTEHGMKILKNFVLGICGAEKGWSMADFIKDSVKEAQEVIGNRKAVIGLSGGVDSSTAAALVGKAIGSSLTAVYVDTGLMRLGETDFIRKAFLGRGIELRVVDAKDGFFKELRGVTDPERKRKIIGKLFVEIFEEAAREAGAEVLVQGTIYSDRIESGVTEHSSSIKSHHNVGGLPLGMKLEVYEPLRNLYKDEVRKVAGRLGLPKEVINRHVFPGPGLAVRVLGEVTPEKVEVVREASHIVEEELRRENLYDKQWMAFAVLLPVKSVGIQGDARSYKHTVAVRIIESEDAMTAGFSEIPHQVLERISTRITNEISEVNRVVYDITNKPPATMEWE